MKWEIVEGDFRSYQIRFEDQVIEDVQFNDLVELTAQLYEFVNKNK